MSCKIVYESLIMKGKKSWKLNGQAAFIYNLLASFPCHSCSRRMPNRTQSTSFLYGNLELETNIIMEPLRCFHPHTL